MRALRLTLFDMTHQGIPEIKSHLAQMQQASGNASALAPYAQDLQDILSEMDLPTNTSFFNITLIDQAMQELNHTITYVKPGDASAVSEPVQFLGEYIQQQI